MLQTIARSNALMGAAAMLPSSLNVPEVRVPMWRPADNQGHYWPCGLLHAFTLQMAAVGYCVNSGMMLGDLQYAQEKLSQAHSSGDEELRELSVKLFGFFDAVDSAQTAH